MDALAFVATHGWQVGWAGVLKLDYIAPLRRSKAGSSGLRPDAFVNEEQLRAVNLFFGLKEKNPKARLLLAMQKLHAEPTNGLYKRPVHIARAAVQHDFAAVPEHCPRPVQMAVALHYFDPAFWLNDDDMSKEIHRSSTESFCMQMFKHAVYYESVAVTKVHHGVLFDKAGCSCYALLRPAKSFRFVDDWHYLGYKRPPKPELLYSEVRGK
jgi:hypothetical protein